MLSHQPYAIGGARPFYVWTLQRYAIYRFGTLNQYLSPSPSPSPSPPYSPSTLDASYLSTHSLHSCLHRSALLSSLSTKRHSPIRGSVKIFKGSFPTDSLGSTYPTCLFTWDCRTFPFQELPAIILVGLSDSSPTFVINLTL